MHKTLIDIQIIDRFDMHARLPSMTGNYLMDKNNN
jgi:hypothetical protein